jgi:hypothetical protein
MIRRILAATTVACLLALTPVVAHGATYQMGPLPSEFSAGILPPSPDTFANTQAARQALTKLQLAVQKCLSKGVTNVSHGKASGLGGCLYDPAKGALPRYQAKIASLLAKPGSLPPCAGHAALGPEVAERTRALHEYVYCGDPPGSPSGAFVDGAPVL